MATLAGPSGLADGHLSAAEGPVAWIGDNHHKGASDVPTVTIHSSGELAARHLESDPAQWTKELCDSARRHLAADIVAATGHRWRYATPRATLGVGAVTVAADAPIALAGEVFSGAKVEGAFLSGMDAAERIADLL